jgi:hypothetical protein
MLARLWGVVLTLMIAYFVLSIVNSTARAYLVSRSQQRVRDLNERRLKLLAKVK